MRCNNCGWDNPPAKNRCEKCNAPLQGSMVKPANPSPSPSQTPESPSGGGNVLSQTVVGGAATGPFLDAPTETPSTPSQDSPASSPGVCPHCEYPVNPSAKICPNCKGQIVAAASPVKPRKKAPLNPKGTVKPDYMAEAEVPPAFSLQPISRENEEEKEVISFDGGEVLLTRDEVEPDNMTITNSGQALVQYVDGKWFLVDKSSLKTTFVYAGEPVEIKNGDIILMGNRKFRFDC